MRIFKFLLIIPCLLSVTGFSFHPLRDLTCMDFHEGSFTYQSNEGKVAVEIKGNQHTERHHKGKYIIESTIEWVSACEYNTTLIKATLPGFPFKPGTTMNVKIHKIEGKKCQYKCSINGDSFGGEMVKVK